MDLTVRILSGLLAGAVTYWIFYRFLLKRNRKIIKPVPKEPRLELLRKYSDYACDAESKNYQTAFTLNRKVPDILLKYNYPAYSGRPSANEDDIVFAMLDFVCDHFRHGADVRLPCDHSLTGIIKGSEQIGFITNCRGLSLILAELLRMNGIKARHVTCKPYEEPFSDCHVVVDCVMPSGKRIMLDPTYRLYFVDESGGDFSYHDYREYMTKNLLRFHTNLILDDSTPDMASTEIELIPKGYTKKGFAKRIKFVTDPVSFWNM